MSSHLIASNRRSIEKKGTLPKRADTTPTDDAVTTPAQGKSALAMASRVGAAAEKKKTRAKVKPKADEVDENGVPNTRKFLTGRMTEMNTDEGSFSTKQKVGESTVAHNARVDRQEAGKDNYRQNLMNRLNKLPNRGMKPK